MISPYLLRLAWMSLASFFLVHLALGLLALSLMPTAIRFAGGMQASSAARFLLAVRVLPCALAILVVVGLCIPSYLWLEPDGALEGIGGLGFTSAALGLGIWAVSIIRGTRAVIRSIRFVRQFQTSARGVNYLDATWVIDDGVPSVGVAGIFRPQIVIRKDVRAALTPEQLDAVLRHEQAHAASHDNLKKLLILLAPDVLPFARTRFQELDRAWARYAEWAADDRAAAGDPLCSLGLAAALVQVTRLGTPSRTPALVTSLVDDADALSVRVNRLLDPKPAAKNPVWLVPLVGVGTLLVAASIVFVPGMPMLHAVHELLEAFVR